MHGAVVTQGALGATLAPGLGDRCHPCAPRRTLPSRRAAAPARHPACLRPARAAAAEGSTAPAGASAPPPAVPVAKPSKPAAAAAAVQEQQNGQAHIKVRWTDVCSQWGRGGCSRAERLLGWACGTGLHGLAELDAVLGCAAGRRRKDTHQTNPRVAGTC